MAEPGSEHTLPATDDLEYERRSQLEILADWVAFYKDAAGHEPALAEIDDLVRMTPQLTVTERTDALQAVCHNMDDPGAPLAEKLQRTWARYAKDLQDFLCKGQAQAIDFKSWAEHYIGWRQSGDDIAKLLRAASHKTMRLQRLACSSSGESKGIGGVEVLHLQGLDVISLPALLEALGRTPMTPGNSRDWRRSISDFKASDSRRDLGSNGRCTLSVIRDQTTLGYLKLWYTGEEKAFDLSDEPILSIARQPRGDGVQLALEPSGDVDRHKFKVLVSWFLTLGMSQSEILAMIGGILAKQCGIRGVAEVCPDPFSALPRSLLTVFEKPDQRPSRLHVNFANDRHLQEALEFSKHNGSVAVDFTAWFRQIRRSVPPPLAGELILRFQFRKVSPTTAREATALASVVLQHPFRSDLPKILQPTVASMLQAEAGGNATHLIEKAVSLALTQFLRSHLDVASENLILHTEVEIDSSDSNWPLLLHIMPFEGAQLASVKLFALQLGYLFANRCLERRNSPWFFYDPIGAVLPSYDGRPSDTSCELTRISFVEVTAGGSQNFGYNRVRAHLVEHKSSTFGDADVDRDKVLQQLISLWRRETPTLSASLTIELAAKAWTHRAHRFHEINRKHRTYFVPLSHLPRGARPDTALTLLTDPQHRPALPPSVGADYQASETILNMIGHFNVMTPVLSMLQFRLPQGAYHDCHISPDFYAPICIGCQEPVSHGYVDPTINLRHCVPCFEMAAAVMTANSCAQFLSKIRDQLGSRQVEPTAAAVEQVGGSHIEELAALHPSFLQSTTTLSPSSWADRVSIEAARGRLRREINGRAQIYTAVVEMEARSGADPGCTQANAAIRNYWSFLLAGVQVHRRRWSPASVERARALLIRGTPDPSGGGQGGGRGAGGRMPKSRGSGAQDMGVGAAEGRRTGAGTPPGISRQQAPLRAEDTGVGGGAEGGNAGEAISSPADAAMSEAEALGKHPSRVLTHPPQVATSGASESLVGAAASASISPSGGVGGPEAGATGTPPVIGRQQASPRAKGTMSGDGAEAGKAEGTMHGSADAAMAETEASGEQPSHLPTPPSQVATSGASKSLVGAVASASTAPSGGVGRPGAGVEAAGLSAVPGPPPPATSRAGAPSREPLVETRSAPLPAAVGVRAGVLGGAKPEAAAPLGSGVVAGAGEAPAEAAAPRGGAGSDGAATEENSALAQATDRANGAPAADEGRHKEHGHRQGGAVAARPLGLGAASSSGRGGFRGGVRAGAGFGRGREDGALHALPPLSATLPAAQPPPSREAPAPSGPANPPRKDAKWRREASALRLLDPASLNSDQQLKLARLDEMERGEAAGVDNNGQRTTVSAGATALQGKAVGAAGVEGPAAMDPPPSRKTARSPASAKASGRKIGPRINDSDSPSHAFVRHSCDRVLPPVNRPSAAGAGGSEGSLSADTAMPPGSNHQPPAPSGVGGL